MFGEIWGCYAKWNKSEREWQVMNSITYMWKFFVKKNTKLIETEVRKWLPGAGGGWNKEGYKF